MSRPARLLFGAVFILIGFGLVMTYSSSAVFARQVYGNAQYFLIRQAAFIGIATVLLFIFSASPLYFWKKNARLVMLASILLVSLVFLPGIGVTAGGANRWLNLGFFRLQPAELAKVATCIYLADYLDRKIKEIQTGSMLVFLPPLILIGAVCILSLLQPDLGSCVFIVAVTALMFFIAGMNFRYVLASAVLLIPVFYFLVIRVPYRLSRVTAYLNPWEDPQGSGFQMIQSILSFGLGGLKGVGLGQSTQKLFYLPSSHNDFILAVIGEELGLIGLLTVLFLFGTILFSGIQISRKCRDFFPRILALSLTFSIVLQALINMMVATGLLPTKGLPLPFISYGGTSMAVNLISVGLLLSIDRHQSGVRY